MTLRVWSGGGRRYAVDEMALACCAVELAVDLPDFDETDLDIDAHVLVVAGTVSRAALPTVLARYEALPEPRYVIAFGACATSGGPYWDSYAVIPGIGESLPVDVFVPGCPPRPHLLTTALESLVGDRDVVGSDS
ncbi:MAG: NADH-quinone oxidoreductase subunit B [Actinobacteria bacterium]|nr:NADH-quinone oxidoreductase subunit B [Actinomycetota bacterium]